MNDGAVVRLSSFGTQTEDKRKDGVGLDDFLPSTTPGEGSFFIYATSTLRVGRGPRGVDSTKRHAPAPLANTGMYSPDQCHPTRRFLSTTHNTAPS